MANTRMFAVALQSKDFKEVHVFKHTVPDDYYTTNHWEANHRDVFNKSVKTKSRLNLKNIEDFSRFNAIYSKFFDKEFPARSAVGVAGLPKNVLIEIEVIAEVKS